MRFTIIGNERQNVAVVEGTPEGARWVELNRIHAFLDGQEVIGCFEADEERGFVVRRKRIVIDYVHIERSETRESGDFDLEGLFVRLNHAIDSIGAKRVVLDTLEVLFASLVNEAVLRAELRRLFR